MGTLIMHLQKTFTPTAFRQLAQSLSASGGLPQVPCEASINYLKGLRVLPASLLWHSGSRTSRLAAAGVCVDGNGALARTVT